MSCTEARQKSVKAARMLRGVTRWSLLVVLIGIGAMSLGFWSNQNGNGRGISAIKMRVSSEAAPRAEFSPQAVQSGPLYVRSPETRSMTPMFLDKTQYRAALRETEAEKSVRGGYEALPDNTVVAFADGEVGLRTRLGI
ncbi:hypothetical protein LJC23_07370, partial [Desulfovibrio sp. OttesenSCG-928-I05]|nr:hypothetical protein [Desulfovibrio sp. OttesenSCG-928-I05]